MINCRVINRPSLDSRNNELHSKTACIQINCSLKLIYESLNTSHCHTPPTTFLLHHSTYTKLILCLEIYIYSVLHIYMRHKSYSICHLMYELFHLCIAHILASNSHAFDSTYTYTYHNIPTTVLIHNSAYAWLLPYLYVFTYFILLICAQIMLHLQLYL